MKRFWHVWLRISAGGAALLILSSVMFVAPTPISAQGVTTSAIRGTIRSENGDGVDGAVVKVVNTSTGYATQTRARGGSFLVQGLKPGGPYLIVVRHLGYRPQRLDVVSLSLGEQRQIEVSLVPLATQLDTLIVIARDQWPGQQAAGGIATSISDSALRRLPTLNRDVYDFVRLVPQVGTRLGLSAGSASFRYNSYVIDGVSDRQLQGNNVMGSIGGKTISLEAVKEYQVLLTPYDARYGDFAGMLVNAVTRSGTNQLHGSAYGYLRDAQLARANAFVGASPYRREQFGFSLGGPIVRDRMHFFIAPEFEHAAAPAPGPYVGQAADASPALPVSSEDITRFASLLRANGLDPGDGARVTSLNPSVTYYARLDVDLPEWKSRVVLRDNYSSVEGTRFTRPDGVPVFPLSSNAWTQRVAKHTSAFQIFTQASTAVFNELVVSYMDRPLSATRYTRSPSIQATVASPEGGAATLMAGPPPTAGGFGAAELLIEIGDHVVFQPGSRHTLGAGVHVELFRYHAQAVRGQFGVWRFSSLDALAAGDASSYTITRDFGSARARVSGAKPSAYITDEWRIRERLSLTLGLRADALQLRGIPAYNAAVDSVVARSTSDYPRTQIQWSPRFGFSWEPFADHLTRVRGGAGIFVGTPPLGWLLGPMRSNGAGVRTLTCSATIGSGRIPKFVADLALQPQSCPDGRGYSDGPVALVDKNLKMAESFRSSLAVDRRLPGQIDATLEALYSRVRSDFMFVNQNLRGPQGVDQHGRVLYGTIDQSGRARPAFVAAGRFPELIDLRNQSLGHAWSVTAQIDRQFSTRYALRAAYTHARARDLQSIINGSAAAPFDIWASARPLSGRHDDMSTGVSSFEIPHRVVLAATYAAPWRRWNTDVSVYYIGESGTPFTFGDSTGTLGDLNADGTSANDPIYVPRNANDPSEIVFSGSDAAAQAAAFEGFISETPCLHRQRGKILARNSCRGPWLNTSNLSVRQSLQATRGHDVSLQLEVFNLLNLLNSSWGLFRIPNQTLLQQVGQTSGPTAQPVFRFVRATAGTSAQNLESSYQLQLSLRYSF